METKTYNQMEYRELENLVKKTIAGYEDYSFVADEECNNGGAKTIDDIDGINDSYDQKRLDEKKQEYMSRILLNELCRLEIIPKGDYIIEIFW